MTPPSPAAAHAGQPASGLSCPLHGTLILSCGLHGTRIASGRCAVCDRLAAEFPDVFVAPVRLRRDGHSGPWFVTSKSQRGAWWTVTTWDGCQCPAGKRARAELEAGVKASLVRPCRHMKRAGAYEDAANVRPTYPVNASAIVD